MEIRRPRGRSRALLPGLVAILAVVLAAGCGAASPSSPVVTTSSPVPAASASSPTAVATTPTATASVPASSSPSTPAAVATPTAVPRWTTAQVNQFVAAYNAGNIATVENAGIACFLAVVQFRDPAQLALDYVAVAWKPPVLPQGQVKQALEAKYGQALGLQIYNAWSPGAVNWGCSH